MMHWSSFAQCYVVGAVWESLEKCAYATHQIRMSLRVERTLRRNPGGDRGEVGMNVTIVAKGPADKAFI